MSFSFDNHQFWRALESEVQVGVDRMADEWSRDLDRLRARLAGRPVNEIKPHLQALFRRRGGTITDPELSEWAQLLSDNTRVTFKPEKIRW